MPIVTYWIKIYAALELSLCILASSHQQLKLPCWKTLDLHSAPLQTTASCCGESRSSCGSVFFVSFLPAPDLCVVIPVSSVPRFGLQFLNLSLPLESKLLLNWIFFSLFPFSTRKKRKEKTHGAAATAGVPLHFRAFRLTHTHVLDSKRIH